MRPSPSLKKSPAPPTRERILDAAAAVFAREGLKAATTREIARAAGMNEVTLFRVFKSKSNLLTAVLDRVFSPPGDVSRGAKARPVRPPASRADLVAIVRSFAQGYSARLGRNLALIRVLVGEIQHFQEHELKVVHSIFRPERQRLIARLREARKLGLVRKDTDPVIAADQISAAFFMGELRGALPFRREYSSRRYLAACVETVVRGIEA